MLWIVRELLVGRCVPTRWRRAIGWIAAYALALQTIAGSIDLVQSAAAASFDPTAIICHGHGADSAADLPGTTGNGPLCDHCGYCLAALPVLAAPSLFQLFPAVLADRQIIWPTADWRNEIAVRHPSRQPRGPPPQA
jgi:hypothetical protein